MSLRSEYFYNEELQLQLENIRLYPPSSLVIGLEFVPRSLPRRHLDDDAARGPDVGGSTVTLGHVTGEYLGGHVRCRETEI